MKGLVLRAVLMLGLSVGVGGCVTTVEGPFTDKVSSKKAVQDYVALGYAYLEAGDVIRAKQRIERALELDADSAEAHTVMAMIWRHEGELELAEKHFEEAIDSGKDSPKTNHYYAEFLMSQGKYEEALEYLEKVTLKLEYEGRPKVMEDAAVCYLKLGRKDDALRAFKKVQRLDSYSATGHLNAAELSWEKGDVQYATRSFNAFRRLVAKGKAEHSPKSVYLGVQLARRANDRDAEKAYVKMLYRNYRGTPEFQAFLETYKPFLR